MVQCVVSGCPNRTSNVNRVSFNRKPKRFFNFPTDPTRVKVWLAALRETDKQDSTEEHFICEDHFLPEDITASGVASDAIPIMSPYLDGPMGLSSPWGAECSEDEDHLFKEEEDDCDEAPPPPVQVPLQQNPGRVLPKPVAAEKTRPPPQQKKDSIQSKKHSRADASLGLLTQRFLQLLLDAPNSTLDLREVTHNLRATQRRVCEVTSILGGINLIQKDSKNTIKWTGSQPISCFLWKDKVKFLRELENLKLVEATLDSLIKNCAQQLFDMTDDVENSASAYVTYEDIIRLQAFQEQTVIAVRAPEETKLEIPVPTETSIKVHLKAGRGPIMVVTCEVDSGDGVTSDLSSFSSLEKSRIRTTTTHAGPQIVGQNE